MSAHGVRPPTYRFCAELRLPLASWLREELFKPPVLVKSGRALPVAPLMCVEATWDEVLRSAPVLATLEST